MANLAGGKLMLRHHVRQAFTLLELILALSLSVVVLLTITMAINVYWKQFDIRRTNVEEAQLARALLRHMADDLRSAMQYSPADLTGLEAVAQNGGAGAAAAALGGGTDGGSDGNDLPGGESDDQQSGGSGQSDSPMGGAKTGDDTGSATGGFTEGGDDPAADEEGAATGSTVGLYGSATELRMDVSRLPRVDQYEALLASPAVDAVEIPSDIKTVTYFLRSEESADAANTPLSTSMPVESTLTGRGRGLMRREVDRATSSWAEQSGGTAAATDQARLLAEEVIGLSFQYFDGTQWLADWNSDEYGGLPLAVEILLIMSDADPDATESPLEADTTAAGSVPTERTYRLVVHLPTATIPTTDPAAEAAGTEAAETLPMEAVP